MSAKVSFRTIGALTVGSLLICTPLLANPSQVKDKEGRTVPGNPRWPRGTTIHVFVPDDPRFNDIKMGIERWSGLLQDKGLTIDVTKGPVPPGATNAVAVNSVDPGSLGKDSEGHQNLAEAGPRLGNTIIKNGQETAGPIIGGTLNISKDVNKNGTESDLLKNLVEHEFGHVLGFNDEPTEEGKPHNVMDHTVEPTGTTAFTDKDKQELNSLYAGANLPTSTGTTFAQVTGLPGQGNAFVFTAQWQDGSTIPFVQIGTNGAPVSEIMAGGFGIVGTSALNPNPAGWFLLDPNNPASLAGSVEDVNVVSPGEGGAYLTFANLLNPLGSENPKAEFGFTSRGSVATVLTFLTADNFITTRGPVAVPEPSTTPALVVGIASLTAALGLRRGRQRGWSGGGPAFSDDPK
jgi:hypothetical protein